MADIDCVIDCKNVLGEGPVRCPIETALYWVDIKGKTINRFRLESGETESWDMPEEVGSLALREGGGIVAALYNGFRFIDLDSGEIEVVHDIEADTPRTRFNDGRCDRRGRFWAGTMDDLMEQPLGSLYRLDPDRSYHKMESGIVCSNSTAFSPDDRTLYFADTFIDTIWAYDLDNDTGAITNRRVFASTKEMSGGPDGSAVDSEGFLWNAMWDGWRVVRYAPDGRIDRVIEMPVQRPTCCAFGGEGLDTLYVTSARFLLEDAELESQPQAGGVFAVDVGVKGLPEPRFAG